MYLESTYVFHMYYIRILFEAANKNNITVKANIFRVLIIEDDNVEADEYEMKFYYYPCPNTKIDNRKAQLKKKRFKLDNELADHLKSGLLCVLYVILLAMICSHNVTTDACRQNNAMSLSINDSFLVCIPEFFNIIFFLFRRTEKNLM